MRTRLRNAMSSVLEALGYSARESWPSQSCKVFSTRLRGRTSKKNGLVRLAKAHRDLALLVCKIPVNQI